MFVSLAQVEPPRGVDLFVRTASNPLALAGSLRAAVRRVEKEAAIHGVVPLERQFGGYLAQRRFQTSLLTCFSLVALLMAAVGIYGLIQYSVATRTHEIGIRMAVGAGAGEILRMVLGEGLRLSLTGLVLGLLGALWLGEAASGLLVGVTATDTSTFVVVSLLLIAVAVAACSIPARRAMRVEPIIALRQG
jgi:putative ABC transport system permease protein